MLRRGLYFSPDDSGAATNDDAGAVSDNGVSDNGNLDNSDNSDNSDNGAGDDYISEISQKAVDDAFGIGDGKESDKKDAKTTDKTSGQPDNLSASEPDPNDKNKDFESLLSDRLSEFEKKFQDDLNARLLQLASGKQEQPEPEQKMNPLEKYVLDKITEREQQVQNERLQVEYTEKIQQLIQANPDDFKDGTLLERMRDMSSGSMTPEDLYFAANRKAIIQREREDAANSAVQMLKEEFVRRRELLLSGKPSNEISAEKKKKNDIEMDFDDIANEEYNKLILNNAQSS